MDLKDLYRDVIVDHNRNPRNFRPMPDADRHAEGFNPLCGDRLTLFVRLDGDRIADVSFQGSGCAISVASASLLTESVKGRTVPEAEQLFATHARAADARGRGRRPGRARQARGAVRRARVPGAREVREPLLAHARRRAAPAEPSRVRPSRRPTRSEPCTDPTTSRSP